MKKIITYSTIFLVALFISGAAMAEKKPVTQATMDKNLQHSGFLSNYDDFKVLNPETNAEVWIAKPFQDLTILKDYRAIILSPVEVWLHSAADYKGVNPDDLKKITDYFESALKERLSKRFELVEKAGPDVMQLRIAITGLETHRAKTKTHIKSRAVVEMEVLDSESRNRLVAAIDQHSSSKLKEGEGAEPYEKILDFWAKRVSNRLNTARNK